MLHQIHPLLASEFVAEHSARLRAEAETYRLAANARRAGTHRRRSWSKVWGRFGLRRSLQRRAGSTPTAPAARGAPVEGKPAAARTPAVAGRTTAEPRPARASIASFPVECTSAAVRRSARGLGSAGGGRIGNDRIGNDRAAGLGQSVAR